MKVFCLIVVVMVLILGAIGCRQDSPLTNEEIKLLAGRLTSTDKTVEVPKKLIQDIKVYYLKHFKMAKIDPKRSDGEILARVVRKTLDLKIKLASWSSSVLVNNASFETGRGGGFLDLAEWVTGVRGDFFLSMKVKWEEIIDPKLLKVYFISRSPNIKIDGENWGLGCDKYADITDFYHKTLSKNGIRLNSTRNRYLYAVTGSFVFAGVENGELFLTSFSVTDSRFRDKLCVPKVTQSTDFE